jgi:hypothetical protein
MEKKDIQISCQDSAAEKVIKLLDLMSEDGSNPSGFKIMFPNGFGIEGAEKTASTRKSPGEWLLTGHSPEMEGSVKLTSLPDGWLSSLGALLATKMGIGMTDRQMKINEAYLTIKENINMGGVYAQLPDLPEEQIGWIEDIEKVLTSQAEEGSHAAEFYGNGDFTLLGLYEERAGLQLEVIEEISKILNGLEEPKEEEEVEEPVEEPKEEQPKK